MARLGDLLRPGKDPFLLCGNCRLSIPAIVNNADGTFNRDMWRCRIDNQYYQTTNHCCHGSDSEQRKAKVSRELKSLKKKPNYWKYGQ